MCGIPLYALYDLLFFAYSIPSVSLFTLDIYSFFFLAAWGVGGGGGCVLEERGKGGKGGGIVQLAI
jgi:hypothetical protein